MIDNYKFIKAYQSNDTYRNSFNELAQSVFALDFEDWYQNGYWTNKYIPYSFLHNDRVIANVSVNPMKFVHNGVVKNYVQLGTVMTDKTYRNQGLIRNIINEIESDYSNKVDGFFLFANKTVLDFYPKFGYERVREHSFYQHPVIHSEMTARKVPMKTRDDFKLMEEAVNNSCIQSRFWMIENMELIMFYVTCFMNQNIYEIKNQNAYVIAELNKGELFLHQVFSPEKVDLKQVIVSFGKEVQKVRLGFTPLEEDGFQWEEIKDGDTVLHGKGSSFLELDKWMQRIPTLSHA